MEAPETALEKAQEPPLGTNHGPLAPVGAITRVVLIGQAGAAQEAEAPAARARLRGGAARRPRLQTAARSVEPARGPAHAAPPYLAGSPADEVKVPAAATVAMGAHP